MFSLTERDLRKLMRMHYFPFPQRDMLFFGLRGCLPVSVERGLQTQEAHNLTLQELDYQNLRCTLGQWIHAGRGFAVFPASTVPHRDNIQKHLDGERKTNQMECGFFKNYRKGRHRQQADSSHDAFRMDYPLVVRRTFDDLDFDLDDRVEYTWPYDNIHAAYTESLRSGYFASAGCQVVMGYPKRKDGKYKANTGPWKVFLETAYALDQRDFYYALFPAAIAERIVRDRVDKHVHPILRFGSTDASVADRPLPALVGEVQEALNQRDYNAGLVDGQFGPRTWKALLAFQNEQMGPGQGDGAVGPITAAALGVNWDTQDFDW
jgi:hypothetical protein